MCCGIRRSVSDSCNMRTIVFIIALAIELGCKAAEPELRFSWNQVDYTWNTPEDREKALEDKKFIPEHNLPLGLARWKNKLFVTLPRWRNGVASTLNYVDVDGAQDQLLKPYPSFEANFISDSATQLPFNNSIFSVFRVDVDACDRLWVMDTGLGNRLGLRHQITGPSIAIFNLNTDELIHRYFIKDGVAKQNSFFANIVVDVDKNTCDKAFAYIADLSGNGVVVYSLKEDDSWLISHNYFHLDPLSGTFNIGGVKVHWGDGVFGLALTEPKDSGYRTMYFHPLTSTREFYVSTELLQNYRNFNKDDVFDDFKILGDRGNNTQSAASFYDPRTHVLFYSQVNRDGVACWNPNKPYTTENNPLIFNDSVVYEFPSDLKVDSEGILWVMSDRLPRFMKLGLESDEVNFRITSIKTKDAIAGTTCESSE